ncbi:MAG TPA: hypothetical protein VJ046_01340 [Candidatus Paceibacterota bacterium]|nr:hypothetical protein [Candidatus Paceibacterota bacterium]
MTKRTNYTPVYGLVCLVDALGAKAYSEKDIVDFLKSREVVYQALKDKCEDQVEFRKINDPKLAFFNDTIIIALEYDKNSNKAECNSLKAMGIIVRKLISDGISKKILFRGAIGIGSFFLDLEHDIIIGQAVADAVNWYETPEIIGCILTPRTGIVLEKHRTIDKKLNRIFLDFDVPLKTGKQKMICINWPKAFFIDSIKPENCEKGKELRYLYSKLSENVIPKTTEGKYYNTIDFFICSSNPNVVK